MLSQALDRFGKNFGSLFLVGLVANLILMVPMMILALFAGATALFGAMSTSTNPMMDPSDITSVLSMFGAMIGVFFLMFIAAVVLTPISLVAQVAAVRDVMAGNTPQVGACLSEGFRSWGRGLGYVFLMYLVMGVALVVLSVLHFIIIIGTIAWIAIALVMMVAFLYGLYAMVSEDLGVGEAFGRAWSGLFKRLGDHFGAAGVLFLIWLVLFVIAIIPILGQIALLVLSFVITPFFILYAAIRYETNVKPYLLEGQ